MVVQDKRNVALDNLRAFLIICVVAGHLLEVFNFQGSRRLYVLLYSFHMPAFVFLSGMCSKLDKNTPRKLFCNYIYPYMIFQTLYITFDRYVLKNQTAYQYTTPYWLLWYMVAMILWQMMLWWYSAIESRKLALGVSIVVALLAGFDPTIGYYLTLSRMLVLFPFFLAGYYGKDCRFFNGQIWDQKNKACRKIQLAALLAGGVMFVGVAICAAHINNLMLYHSYAYYYPDYWIIHRVLMIGIACIWIGVLFALVPRKKILWITHCGRNTMPVFVLHGFIVRLLNKEIANLQIGSHCFIWVVLSMAIPIALTLPPVLAITKPLMRLPEKRFGSH